MMSTVVTTPTIVRTVAQLCLVARALHVVEPDLSTAWSVSGVVDHTPVVSIQHIYSRASVQLLQLLYRCLRLCQQPCCMNTSCCCKAFYSVLCSLCRSKIMYGTLGAQFVLYLLSCINSVRALTRFNPFQGPFSQVAFGVGGPNCTKFRQFVGKSLLVNICSLDSK